MIAPSTALGEVAIQSGGSRLDSVLELLDRSRLQAQAHGMLHDLGASEDQDAVTALANLIDRLDDIGLSLRDVCPEGDEYELALGLPNAWLELRLLWSRWNLRMQYQTMTTGCASGGLMVGGAMLGELIESMERLLDAESALLVHKIADDPFGTARGSAQRTERLFERMSSACDGGNRAVEAMLLAQDQLLRLVDTPAIRRELDKAIRNVIDEISTGLLLSGDDLAPALEAVILRTLGTAAVRVVPQIHGIDPQMRLAPDVSMLLLEVIEEWLSALGAQSLRLTPAERAELGKSAYVTIDFHLAVEGDDVVLTLRDDADGMVDYERHKRSDAMRNVRVKVEQTAGVGSTLEIRCSSRKVDEYLLLRVVEGSHDGGFAVPLRAVQTIEHRPAEDLCVHGTRLMGRNGDTIRVVDLGEELFRTPLAGLDVASYVHVTSTRGELLALRVRAVEGIRRATLRSVPESFEGTMLRGFIQADQQVIGVIDLAQFDISTTAVAVDEFIHEIAGDSALLAEPQPVLALNA